MTQAVSPESSVVFYMLSDGTQGSMKYPKSLINAIAAATNQLIHDGARGFVITAARRDDARDINVMIRHNLRKMVTR